MSHLIGIHKVTFLQTVNNNNYQGYYSKLYTTRFSGLVNFTSRDLFITEIGDTAIVMGTLGLFTGVLYLLSVKKCVILLPVAFMIQLAVVTLLWQQLDGVGYLLHQYLERASNTESHYLLALTTQMFFVINLCIAMILFLLTARLLQKSKYILIENSSTRTEELITMENPEN